VSTDIVTLNAKSASEFSKLATQINEHHRLCETSLNKGLEHAIEAGRLLLKAKQLCARGKWLVWLRENFDGSERTAQTYIQAVRLLPRLNGNPQRVADFSLRGVVKAMARASCRTEGEYVGCETPALPEGVFDLLYADPPWRYERGSIDPSRRIENHYRTMELSEICSLPVSTIAAEDCVLVLWATSPKLAEAMQVVSAWGFDYRTCMVWVKDRIGPGHYVRQQHELLLICAKGEPGTPQESCRPASVVEAPRGQHSEKPVVFYEIIERMYPDAKKLELFCRKPREGWAAWGDGVCNGSAEPRVRVS
jgi:N6-adenosine-specific RNA methylase IME4